MNRSVAGLISFIVSTSLFVSLAFASVMWSTTNISSVNASLTYVDPATGKKVVRKFIGSMMNFYEMHRDLTQNHHFVHIHSENSTGLNIDADFVGGGFIKSTTTTLLGTWDNALPAPALNFADGIFMDPQDVRALVLNSSYTVNSANAASANARIYASGMLSYFSSRIPARVYIQISARNMPPVLSPYSTINRGLTVIPNNNSRPIAVDQSLNISFGNTTSVNLFKNAVSFQTPTTLNATVVGDPLNGTLPAAGNYPTGIVTYKPKPGFWGTDVFDYYVRDVVNLASDTKRVTVNIAPPPATIPQDLPVMKNFTSTPLNLTFTGLNSKVIAVTAQGAQHGTIGTTPAGVLTYKPAKGYDGIDYFTYTLSSAKTGWNTTGKSAVVITPTALDDVVSLTTISHTINVNTQLLSNDIGTGTISIVDVFESQNEGTPILSADKASVFYTPRLNIPGETETFTYVMTDGSGQTSTASVTVKIQ